MKMMRLCVLLMVLLFCFGAFAQKKTKDKKKKEKEIPENIEVFKRDFMIRPRFVLPSVWFNVSGRGFNGANSFTWKPALPRVVGLAFKIKKVYVSAAFKLPSSPSYSQRFGDSKSRNIFLNIQGRTLLWTLFYRDYTGFYFPKYEKSYPNWNFDSLSYPKLDNLRIIEGGINLGFNFNKAFSLNAAFSQSERQKKGAGSFLMAISERYQRIEGDTNIVPWVQENNYPSLTKLKFGNFFSTIISFGSGYQFVFRKFHMTPILMLGAGFQFQKYTQAPKREKFRLNFPTYANFRYQIGYNGEHFFTNIIYSLEFNSIPIRETRIRLVHNWIEFGLGVRF